MKTRKLKIAMRMMEQYTELTKFAYMNYVSFINECHDYVCNKETKTDMNTLRSIASAALSFALRANTVYDCSFMVDVKGLTNNLLDVQRETQKKYSLWNTDLDSVVDSMGEFLRTGHSEQIPE